MTELGKRLREARELKGLSLDDLQEITKIQKRYLVGIEEGNYQSMPGEFYVRAFIKQYCEAVGLEPEAIFDEFESDIPVTQTNVVPEQLSRVKTRKAIPTSNSKIMDILPKILVGIFIIGAFVFIWYLMQQFSNDKQQVDDVKQDETVNFEESETAKDKPADKKDNSDKVEDTDETKDNEVEEDQVEQAQQLKVLAKNGRTSTFELSKTDKFELKLVSTNETWVSVKNGKGYSFFEGMLVKDKNSTQTVDLSKETEINLIIGNTINTEIYINDEKLEYAVVPTEEVRQDIKIQYVKEENQE